MIKHETHWWLIHEPYWPCTQAVGVIKNGIVLYAVPYRETIVMRSFAEILADRMKVAKP